MIIAGCSQKKLNCAAPAIELNQGQLFRSIKKLAKAHNFDLKILSGKYGLLDSDQIISPYNQKIRTKKDVLRVRRIITPRLIEIHDYYDLIIVILGKKYLEVIEPLIDNKFLILYDRRGIGGYLSLFSKYNKLPKNQLLKELEKFRVRKFQPEIYQKERIEV
ncbi:hypothetical protein ES707_02301 [subsurface metagenome]